MSKKEMLLYKDTRVCRADFDRLHELDTQKAKLRDRADLAVKTLSELQLTDTANIKLTQRYIDTTYPNSLKNIEEKRAEILKKYEKSYKISPKLKEILLNIAFIIIAITVIAVAVFYIITTARL